MATICNSTWAAHAPKELEAWSDKLKQMSSLDEEREPATKIRKLKWKHLGAFTCLHWFEGIYLGSFAWVTFALAHLFRSIHLGPFTWMHLLRSIYLGAFTWVQPLGCIYFGPTTWLHLPWCNVHSHGWLNSHYIILYYIFTLLHLLGCIYFGAFTWLH